MSTYDPKNEERDLGTTIGLLLAPFESRRIDDSLLAEITAALNEGLVSILDGRRVTLLGEGSEIRIQLSPDPTPQPGSDRSTSPSLFGFDAVAAALAA